MLVWLAVEYWTDGRRGIGGFAGHVWQVMCRMHIGGGFLLYLALVVPWFYAIHVRTGGQYTAEMFEGDAAAYRPAWEHVVGDVLYAATLSQPDSSYQRSGGRRGFHTEHLGFLLAEMQWMQRSYPGVEW